MTDNKEIVPEEMTFEEMLREDLDDEGNDHAKYMKLADQADIEYPDRGYGSILRQIAIEEIHHRKHLANIIHDIHKHEESAQ